MKRVPGCTSLLLALCMLFSLDALRPAYAADLNLEKVLPAWEASIEKARKDWEVPGLAVAVVHRDKMVYAKGFGQRQLGQVLPVTPETIFRIGSTSKAFTAALMAMEADAGKLAWKDPVIAHKPDFVMYDPWVTRQFQVWDLMAQHSGMPAYAGDFMALLGFSDAHIQQVMRHIKPVSSFRAEYAYVNNLWLTAGDIIEASSGKPWDVNLAVRILQPLDMHASSASMRDYQNAKNKAVPHIRFNGEIVPYPEVSDWTYIYNPAGGINSNVRDMSNWMRLMLGKGEFEGNRLLSEENVQYLTSPKTILPTMGKMPASYYCLGWVYMSSRPYPAVWHTGGTSGMSSLVMLVPELDLGFVCLTNSGGNNLSLSLGLELYDLLVGAPDTDWNRFFLDKAKEAETKQQAENPQKPDNALPPQPLENYAGAYANPLYDTAHVTTHDKGLILSMGPRKQSFALVPWNQDIFTFKDRIFGDDTCYVSFDSRPEGISGFTLDCLDTDGMGTFQRTEKDS